MISNFINLIKFTLNISMFHYSAPEFKDTENYYIDVFNGGQFLTKKNCPRIGGVSRCPIEKYNVHEEATAVEVDIKFF